MIQDIKYKQQLFEQKAKLDNAVIQLKKEFIGIDSVIDQIGTATNSWFFFPELQERPIIINLWGLTGTGKTSLVKRFTELIGYSEQYFHFDLGESSGQYYDIQESFNDIYENCDGVPFIIGLDEFQFARTINEDQEEVNKPSIRAMWDLLDTGKFDMLEFDYNMSWFNKLIKKLDMALSYEIEVKKGLVVSNKKAYVDILSNDAENESQEEEKKDEVYYFVSGDAVNKIYNIKTDWFLSRTELRNKLNEMSGHETVDYLMLLYKKALKPKTVDCTKALIFVMGNLDEVYSMTRNFNPDISADEFHYHSSKITITEVKDALLARFRSEQIARLGNTHIIYPSFNEKAFFNIIDLEINRIRKKIKDTYQLELIFDNKIKQLIYEEGVYPTQGTRPLFTTIYQIVNTRLGKILHTIYFNDLSIDTIVLTTSESDSEKDSIAVKINFLLEDKVVYTFIDQQALILGKLRKETRDDVQAIVAVHESGHAILSALLMKTIPQTVFSTTADSECAGFVLSRPELNYISKKEIVNRIAVLLGGFVAERFIFGDENVTLGASSDLSKATKLATRVLYTCGMGETRAVFGNENQDDTPAVIFDNNHGQSINIEAKELIIKAEKLAEETLIKQKKLLLRMSDYLSDKRCLKKEDIKGYISKYAVDFDLNCIVEDGSCLFYRNHLKNMINKLD